MHPFVRTRIGSYIAETVGANANSIGAQPPPTNDRRLRRLLIRTGTIDLVPGNMAQRPIDVSFVGVLPPPQPDAAPRAVFAVFAPPSAFPPGPTRFIAEANTADSAPAAGDVFQGETVAQVPPVGDLPPSPVRAYRQFVLIPLSPDLPPGPTRLTVTLRFADGTTGTGVSTFSPDTGQ